MNQLRFESITGHEAEIRRLDDTNRKAWVAACSCSCFYEKCAVVIYGEVRTNEEAALQSLIRVVLQEHRQIVLDRAGWKCELCGKIEGLDVHHKKLRSHGVDHRITNLQALCQCCHDAEHGVRRADGGL